MLKPLFDWNRNGVEDGFDRFMDFLLVTGELDSDEKKSDGWDFDDEDECDEYEDDDF